jgi:hypothetical protein
LQVERREVDRLSRPLHHAFLQQVLLQIVHRPPQCRHPFHPDVLLPLDGFIVLDNIAVVMSFFVQVCPGERVDWMLCLKYNQLKYSRRDSPMFSREIIDNQYKNAAQKQGVKIEIAYAPGLIHLKFPKSLIYVFVFC